MKTLMLYSAIVYLVVVFGWVGWMFIEPYITRKKRYGR